MLLKLKNYIKRTNPFIRFLIVGVINTLVGLSIMFALVHLFHVPYWVATFSGNTVGAVVSYFLNRSFTFESTVPFGRGAIRFFVVILTCYFFAYSISEFVSEQIGSLLLLSAMRQQDLAILLGTGLYTLTNYMGQKWIVFRKSVPQH